MSDLSEFDGGVRPRKRNLRLRRRESRESGFVSRFVGVYGVLAGLTALLVWLIGLACLWSLLLEHAGR